MEEQYIQEINYFMNTGKKEVDVDAVFIISFSDIMTFDK